jgi:ATP-dependent exoDNAse (exonuclease V) alpha subunit
MRVGDKMMQVVSNYDRLVFNGDVGRIRRIDLENQKVLIQFDEEEGALPFLSVGKGHVFFFSVATLV